MADDRRLSGGTVRAHEALDRALRDEPGRVLSVLVRSLGDIDLAEDALQDAAAAALDRWPVDGVPANPLGQQDRTLWDGAAITEANRLLAGAAAAARDDPPGPYQLQAAIASVHANAARPEDTRWHDIARLYDGLVVVAPTPVFRLNRAVAYSMTAGPEEALAQVDALAGLDTFHLFHATRADLLRRLDRPAEADAAYRTALKLTTNEAERRHLERRIAECGRDRPGSDDAAGYLT